jgi:poly [ADP-ribose] polymerase 10/14/15
MFYLQYAAKRKELQNKNGRNPERWLWHGTAADTVDKIIHHGFNRSYCGKNGMLSVLVKRVIIKKIPLITIKKIY